jgi:hypothetical protein
MWSLFSDKTIVIVTVIVIKHNGRTIHVIITAIVPLPRRDLRRPAVVAILAIVIAAFVVATAVGVVALSSSPFGIAVAVVSNRRVLSEEKRQS